MIKTFLLWTALPCVVVGGGTAVTTRQIVKKQIHRPAPKKAVVLRRVVARIPAAPTVVPREPVITADADAIAICPPVGGVGGLDGGLLPFEPLVGGGTGGGYAGGGGGGGGLSIVPGAGGGGGGGFPGVPTTPGRPVPAIPETGTWGMMTVGFLAIGTAMRGRKRKAESEQ